MNRLLVILAVLTVLSEQLIAQQNTQNYITEYYRLISVNRDSTSRLCDQLIETNHPNNKAFGYAGKAHLSTLTSDFTRADELFKKAELDLYNYESGETIELKGHIQLFKALRFIESHELEEAIKILSEISSFCNNDCSFLLTNKVQSALGRSYSLSNQHLNALQISHVSLNSISALLEDSEDSNLKDMYARALINAANRSINLYMSDRGKFSEYLDSAKYFTGQAKTYIDNNGIDHLQRQIISKYVDINFHVEENYVEAKFYLEKALPLYEGKGYTKKVEQIKFLLAQCFYELNQYDSAENILTRQLNKKIWSEYQLLKFDHLAHYYLFRIYAEKGDSEKALSNAIKYGEKIGEYYRVKNKSDLKVNDLYHSDTKAKEMKVYIDNYHQQSYQKRLFALLSLLLMVIIIFTILYYVRANKKKIKNIRELNRRIAELPHDIDKTSNSKGSSLTDAEARLLLNKLKQLEQQELYLKSDYGLNLVAQTLGTNTSYLSKTVNTYLEVSFAEYSNRLKVNSIVNKIKKHRYYRNYTIDALANEAGYKSVNSFNTNFKKLLKVTPSQYLKELNKIQNQPGGGGSGRKTHSQNPSGTH